MDKETAKLAIRQRIPMERYLKRSKGKQYQCPLCGSGTGKNGSGALTVYPESKTWHCFSCGQDGDVIDLYQLETGVDFLTALQELAQEAGIDVDQDTRRPAGGAGRPQERRTGPGQYTSPQEARKTPPGGAGRAKDGPQDFTAYYEEAHRALQSSPEALAYLQGRGITGEAIEHFNLGFAPSWKNPGGSMGDGTARIIVPLWEGGYLARAIRPVERGEKIHAGQKRPFNLDGLAPGTGKDGSFSPIVVEGAFDAMTLWQWGYHAAIALNGSGTACKDFVEAARSIAPDAVYVLALDNDETGRSTQGNLADSLTAAGLHWISVDTSTVYGRAKDANEAQAQGCTDEARDGINRYMAQAYDLRRDLDDARERERYRNTGPGMIDAFMEEITGEKYKPIPTGIPAIDYATTGGFMRQTLVLLGAEPGGGKTCLASQIFENMAKNGHMTLYFNLEMSRNQLIARSLSRIAYQTEGHRISAVDVLQGYRHTRERREIVERAASVYREDIADGVLYNPGDTGPALDAILSYIDGEAQRQEAAGHPAPLVCIDYLQLLVGGDREDAGTIIKRAVAGLKSYATRHDSVVFAIQAQSRAANRSREASQAAGRDTSALEYSADLMLQLKRDEDEIGMDETVITPTVTLYVTKNRFGYASTKKGTPFLFHGGQSYFEAVDTTHNDPGGGDFIELQADDDLPEGWKSPTKPAKRL